MPLQIRRRLLKREHNQSTEALASVWSSPLLPCCLIRLPFEGMALAGYPEVIAR
jgi:hypothetical protein